MRYVIGIDPDSDRLGFSVYDNGKLIVCTTATVQEILTGHLQLLQESGGVHFSIENVMANQFVYSRNVKASKAAQSKVAMHIGRCQQAQVELIRWLEHYGITYELHKPQRGNWAKNKALFEKATGWTGRSNDDSRSAAYFGWLAIQQAEKMQAVKKCLGQKIL